MRLDIIVATFNRASLLSKLLESLRVAILPPDLTCRVIVVDNNSTDATRDVVQSFPPIHGQPPTYLFEPIPGQTPARNRGLRHASADLIGFLDDDEQVTPDWLIAVRHAFDDPAVGFISGPYDPNWGAPAPAWLPKDYPAVIGWIDGGSQMVEYGERYNGTMMGGNAVIRKVWVDRVGIFDPSLGRVKDTLFTGEDADYHARLIDAGARGFYLPSVRILHHIPPERLTKSYFRRWCYYRGISLAAVDRQRPAPVPYLFGVPRYLAGRAVRGLGAQISGALGRLSPDTAFSGQLAVWDFLGFFVGKHLYRHTIAPVGSGRVAMPGPTTAA
jgi:glucosyl-dolichyl phosphate glucuronosyltransferase